MGKPIAFNTGSRLTGTIKSSTLAVGNNDNVDWGAGQSNKTWYNGIDSGHQYVIITGSNPPAMWATGDFTDANLLATINGLPDRVGYTRFTDVKTAVSWSVASGKYTILKSEDVYPSPNSNGLIVSFDPKTLNRIPNGNFMNYSSYGGDRYPFYFDYGSPSPTVVDISNDKPYVGSNSTKAMKMFAGGGFWAGIGGKLGLEVGKQYTLSWWYKQNNSNNYRFVWNNQGGSGDNNFYLGTATATTTWSRSSITFTHVIDKFYFFTISNGSDAGSELLMTEIQLEEGNTPTTYKNFGDYDLPSNGGTITGSWTLNNMTGYQQWAWDGSKGGCYNFDGTNDFISMPFNSGLVTNTVTVNMWCYADTLNTYRTPFTSEPGLGAGVNGYGFRQRLDNTWWWVIGYEGNGAATATSLEKNTWVNLTGTYDGTTVKLYKNGLLVSSTSGGGRTVNFTSPSINGNIRIGSLTSGNDFFSGKIASLNIYNRTLSATEIKDLFESQKSRFGFLTPVETGLVLHLDAGDPNSYSGTGTTWYDLSGRDNNATLVNNPTYNTDNGGYFQFDGASDYASIYMGTNSGLGVGSKCSLEMYVKNDYSMRAGAGGSHWNFGFEGSGFSHTGGGRGSISSYFQSNQFHHYVFIWDQATNSNLMYRDGILVYTANTGNWSAVDWLGGYFILGGANGNGNNVQSYGSPHIATLKLYNRILTSNEVWQNYNATKSKFSVKNTFDSNLQIHWDASLPTSTINNDIRNTIDTTNGTTTFSRIVDLSGNNRHLTQTVKAQQLLYSPSNQNLRAGVTSTGAASTGMAMNGTLTTGARSFFIVGKGSSTEWVSWDRGGAVAGSLQIGYGGINGWNDSVQDIGVIGIGGGNAIDTYIVSYLFDSSQTLMYRNGNLNRAQSNSTFVLNGSTVSIFSRYLGGTTYDSQQAGTWYEVIYLSKIPTISEYNYLMTYLGEKWNVSYGLLSNYN